jgi:hypothetical protein
VSGSAWLALFVTLWALITALVVVFVIIDYRNAFDNDPDTPTFSGFIKRWRRARWYRTPLLGSACLGLFLPPPWLFGHLVLELW